MTVVVAQVLHVAETGEIKLLYKDMASDTVIVSFSHMDYPFELSRFWGDAVIEKAGYAGLGVVAKGNNWFPVCDRDALSEIVRRLTAKFEHRILYGFSMGGYGALKYSKSFASTCCLALSPQYSIDPADVGADDQRLVRHYKAAVNRGMAIEGKDLADKLIIFYDCHHQQDSWNVEKIVDAASSSTATVSKVHVPGIGHNTINVFASSKGAADLFAAARTRNLDEIQLLTSRLSNERKLVS